MTKHTSDDGYSIDEFMAMVLPNGAPAVSLAETPLWACPEHVLDIDCSAVGAGILRFDFGKYCLPTDTTEAGYRSFLLEVLLPRIPDQTLAGLIANVILTSEQSDLSSANVGGSVRLMTIIGDDRAADMQNASRAPALGYPKPH